MLVGQRRIERRENSARLAMQICDSALPSVRCDMSYAGNAQSPMTPGPTRVGTIGDFLSAVTVLQQSWKKDKIEELWFRGESARHDRTTLRPTLYRSGRPTTDILDQEGILFREFTRSDPTLSEVLPENGGEWYFLMQHHGGPTRRQSNVVPHAEYEFNVDTLSDRQSDECTSLGRTLFGKPATMPSI